MTKYTPQRLLEMMNRVGGMPMVTEVDVNRMSNLPPGISPEDFTPLEKYVEEVPCATNVNEDNPSDMGANMRPVDDIQKLLKQKSGEIKAGHQDYETGGRIHGGTLDDIASAGGKFNVDELKKILMHVPTQSQFLTKNRKMGKSNFYNVTLPAFKGLIYNQTDDKFYVVTTCSKAGECTKDCYAQMGRYIMFDVTVRLNTQRLNYLMNHWTEWKARMVATIKALSWDGGAVTVIRWHDSGDFLSEKYLQMAFDVAKETPKDHHYAYSKEVSMIQNSQVPPNFEVKFSYGGKEDAMIDPQTQGHARVVPEELFKDLQPKETGKGWEFTPEAIETLKDRIAQHYGVERDRLKTNAELVNIPKGDERKWIAVNWSGMDDRPALRRDVLGVYNLKHR
jgi:hypothetical protein